MTVLIIRVSYIIITTVICTNNWNKKPGGTRLATFHSLEDEIPQSYHEVGSEFDNLLKFWIKI